MNRNQKIGIFVGLTVAIGGGVWYYLTSYQKYKKSVTIGVRINKSNLSVEHAAILGV